MSGEHNSRTQQDGPKLTNPCLPISHGGENSICAALRRDKSAGRAGPVHRVSQHSSPHGPAFSCESKNKAIPVCARTACDRIAYSGGAALDQYVDPLVRQRSICRSQRALQHHKTHAMQGRTTRRLNPSTGARLLRIIAFMIYALQLLSQALSILLVRLPIWTIVALPRNNRPRRSWSLTRALWVQALSATVRFGECVPCSQLHYTVQLIRRFQWSSLQSRLHRN